MILMIPLKSNIWRRRPLPHFYYINCEAGTGIRIIFDYSHRSVKNETCRQLDGGIVARLLIGDHSLIAEVLIAYMPSLKYRGHRHFIVAKYHLSCASYEPLDGPRIYFNCFTVIELHISTRNIDAEEEIDFE